jgi:hypothetical protein
MGLTFDNRDSVTCTTHAKITRQLLLEKLSQRQSKMTFEMTKDSREPTNTARYNQILVRTSYSRLRQSDRAKSAFLGTAWYSVPYYYRARKGHLQDRERINLQNTNQSRYTTYCGLGTSGRYYAQVIR